MSIPLDGIIWTDFFKFLFCLSLIWLAVLLRKKYKRRNQNVFVLNFFIGALVALGIFRIFSFILQFITSFQS